MNKTELIAAAADKAQLSKAEMERVVSQLLTIIAAKLREGEKIQLLGFGTFEVKTRSERKGRNPRSGEEIIIPAAKNPTFTPGKTLRDLVNERTFIDEFLTEGKIDEEEAQVLTYVFQESMNKGEQLVQVDVKVMAEQLHIEHERAEEIANALIRKRILNTMTYYGSTDSVYLRARWRKYL